MRIGELSRRTGVHERLLRYYEEQQLLHPARRPNGYREYGEADVATVRRIRSLLAAGLHTATIATLLPCLREEADRLVPTCPDLLADLLTERARISQAIRDLESSRTALDEVISAAPTDLVESAAGTTAAPTPPGG